MCHLKKARCRFKKSPRAWFDNFSIVVIQFSQQQSVSDHSTFVLRSSASTTILVVYIDDIKMTDDDSRMTTYLSNQFHVKNPSTL